MKRIPPPQTVLFAVSIVLSFVSGCRQEQQLPPKVDPTHSHPINKQETIVVPPDVSVRWKAVRIAVVDKSKSSQKSYVIPIGGKLAIPATTLEISVETFLPSFTIQGSIMTSTSNELNNPGVKVRITENGAVIFNGWLFSKFPKTHAFMHPIYGFTLVDVVPAHK